MTDQRIETVREACEGWPTPNRYTEALESLAAENERLREALGEARPYVYNVLCEADPGWRMQTAADVLERVDKALGE